MADDCVAAAVAELYGADPDAFTERRKALAAAAREAGDKQSAAAITALRKPTRAAWVVNQLARTGPDAAVRMAALAADLRAAEQAGDGRRLRELYLRGWREYLALKEAGLVAWAPITDRERESQVLAQPRPGTPLGNFAEHLDEVPVLLIVLADLRELAAMDRDNDRYTFVGGATVYPFAWNIMLAARDQGLVGVLTTLFSRTEPEVLQALGIPAEFSIAAAIALGHPLEEPVEPGRATVEQFTSIDELSGPAFTISDPITAG